ncbi:MAG TPA: tetratricopeptide repeat protein [Streptosporangiaceae bacterium]|nr:tetratricopeptide repeat protein [Streptosporangiaceae bacterium]
MGRGEDTRSTVTSTWELSLAALQGTGLTHARDLLLTLSCFAPAPIPAELCPPSELGEFVESTAAAEDSLHGLLQLGLIETADSSPYSGQPAVTIHPLLAETMRRDPGNSLTESLRRAARIFAGATASLRAEYPADRASWLSLLPHLRAMLSITAVRAFPLLADLSSGAIDALCWAGSYRAAREFAEFALSRLSELDPTGESILHLRFRHAGALRLDGEAAAAEKEHRDVLRAQLRLFDPDSPTVLTTQHYLAVDLLSQGKYAEAQQLFQHVIDRRLQTLGSNHPHTLATRHQLAAVLMRSGRPAQAEGQSREVLEARLRVLGPDHPSTISTQGDIAEALAAQGNHSAAEVLLRTVIAARTRALGPTHPVTLRTRHDLAANMAAQGRHAEAIAAMRQVLAAQTEALSIGDPSIQQTLDWLNNELRSHPQRH